MDYEKKYKKKLDDARYWHDVSEGDIPAVLEDIFPELKESEDEKIRKVLIEYFNRYKEQEECGIKTFFGISTDDILTWLEKQGEQKPEKKELKKINSYCQEHCKGYQETGKCFVDGGCNAKREAEKIENTSPLLSDFFNAEYERGKSDALQSVEWNEEDEQNINAVLSYINDESLQRWLKDTITKRYDKHAYWSEKDEKIVTGIINDIQERLEDYPTEQLAERYFKEIKWLKSLKERYTWKPSDEQMEGIECTIETLRYQLNAGDNRLDSLYNDLKKLRKE